MKELDPALTYGVIGDVHMKIDTLQRIITKHNAEVDHYILLGDWQDAFPPQENTAERTAEYLNYCLTNPQLYTCLWGNHDISYFNHKHSCSGWQPDRLEAMRGTPWDRFHLAAYITSVWPEETHWLFTHAGLSQRWFRDASYLPISPNLVEVIAILEQAETDLKLRLPNLFLEAGCSRGGKQAIGGVLWADWSELDAIEGIRQVVGHTLRRSRAVEFKDTSVNLDTNLKQIVIMNVEKEEFRVVECV